MILEVFMSFFLVWLIWWIGKTYQKRRGMPPGPTPLPVIGNMWQMRFGIIGSFEILRDRYGDIFTVSLPRETVVVLNSTKLVREALTEKNIAGRQNESASYPTNIILEGKTINNLDYSPKLIFRRKVFKSAMHLHGTFGTEQADQRTYEAAKSVVRKIEEMNCRPFSPRELVRSAIISSMWQWLSSKKYPFDHSTINLLDGFIRKFVDITFFGGFYSLIPMAKYLPTKVNRYLKDVLKIREDIFAAELREHRATYVSGVTRDLIDSFLSSYEKEMAKESSQDIGSADDIKGLMMDVAIAGIDSSSLILDWFILYMIVNQDVQEKIHAELDEVVGRDHHPRWKDAEKLHYFQATTLEVIRHSSAVLVFNRNVRCDTTISGYRVPKDTTILLNISNLNKDPQQWKQPERFQPERFVDANGKFAGWGAFPAFFPFGLGHRRCPGEPLAKITLFTFMSTLLHHFRFELPKGEPRPKLRYKSDSGPFFPEDYMVSAIKRI